MSEEVCGICGQTRAAHAHTAHKFSVDGVLEVKPEKRPPVPKSGGSDHVLRMLLIHKGIITQEEITGMEMAARDALNPDPPR